MRITYVCELNSTSNAFSLLRCSEQYKVVLLKKKLPYSVVMASRSLLNIFLRRDVESSGISGVNVIEYLKKHVLEESVNMKGK